MKHRIPVAVLLLLMAAAPAGAASQKVKKGQSYADVARAAYRDAELGRVLALHNGLDPRTPATVGTKLHLPRAKMVRLMIPQRFEDLAWRQLGDDDLGPLLAAINGRHPEDHPKFRDHVIIPAMLDHSRSPGESLEDVARLFYGQGGAVWPLELANPGAGLELKVPMANLFLEKLNDEERRLVEAAQRRFRGPRRHLSAPAAQLAAKDPPQQPLSPKPQPGTATKTAATAPTPHAEEVAQEPAPAATPTRPVTVAEHAQPQPQAAAKEPAPTPTRSPKATANEPGPVEPVRAQPPPEAPQPASEVPVKEPLGALSNPLPFAPLERVRRDYHQGNFHQAQTAVTSLLHQGSVPAEHRSTAWLLLGMCRIARSEDGEAVNAFRQARRLQPGLRLDPFFYPPKVRAAFDRAG